jgi:hypothetical protein
MDGAPGGDFRAVLSCPRRRRIWIVHEPMILYEFVPLAYARYKSRDFHAKMPISAVFRFSMIFAPKSMDAIRGGEITRERRSSREEEGNVTRAREIVGFCGCR